MEGLVLKSTGSWYSVLSEGEIINCKLKGKLRLKGIKTTNPVTVGDVVKFNYEETDGTGIITEINPRKNYIIRKATQFHKESHLIAANIDQAFLMVSLKSPKTPLEFIDRFLLAAEMFFIEAKILINKTDLVYHQDVKNFQEIYNKAGYDCIAMSVTDNINLDFVKEQLSNKISLIAGNSGVGKSSLINYYNPNLNLKIELISDYHKTGKHTTTFSEMHPLFKNTYMIDTPGIRSYGLIDISKQEIGLFFKEIFHNSKNCKFSNCTHIHEPGCAVRQAVEDDIIHPARYNSYVNIFLDDENKHR